MKQVLFASELLYVSSIGLSKSSTAMFLGSLTRNERQKRTSLAIAIGCIVWTAASVLVIALRGTLTAPWMSTNSSDALVSLQCLVNSSQLTKAQYYRWLSVEASGLGLEAVLWILSVSLVWGLKMELRKRLKVISLFGFRFLYVYARSLNSRRHPCLISYSLIPIVTARLYFISVAHKHQSTSASIMAQIFTEMAMQYSLMAECMSCLKPFLQPFHSGYGFSNNYALSSLSNPSRDPYAELSKVSHTELDLEKPVKVLERETPQRQKGYTSPQSQRPPRRQDNGTFRLRSDYASFTTNVEANRSHNRSHTKLSDEDDIELLRQQNPGIQQTTTVSVVDESAGWRN